MPDRPGEEGFQAKLAPLRSPASTPEARRSADEGRSFHAEFSITLEDAMAVHDRAMRALKAGAPKPSLLRRLLGVGLGLLFAAFPFASRAGLVPEWVGIVLPSVGWMCLGSFLTLVALLISSRRSNRAVVRRLYENDRSLYVTHRVTLTPESVDYAIGARSGRVLWMGVVDVTETLHYLFISYSRTDIIAVPRHAFAGRKDYEAFAEGAEEFFRASGSARKADADAAAGSPSEA